tara:strand:- start:26 stop:421 length:396 start_codon:yes stop_codon:yes gene_type:complete
MSATRTSLLSQITTNIAGSNISVSSELPFTASGQSLYLKNMKHFYMDEEQDEREQVLKTLDGFELEQTTISLEGYMSVDAKNQPGDIANVVANIMNANSVITGTVSNDTSVTTELEDDVITYTFEFNFITI